MWLVYLTKILPRIQTTSKHSIVWNMPYGILCNKTRQNKQINKKTTLQKLDVYRVFQFWRKKKSSLFYPVTPVEGATQFLFGINHILLHTPDKCPRFAVYINSHGWLWFPLNCIIRLMEFMWPECTLHVTRGEWVNGACILKPM